MEKPAGNPWYNLGELRRMRLTSRPRGVYGVAEWVICAVCQLWESIGETTLNEETVLLSEEECYTRLRDDIRRGVLMPNQHLVEMDLASSLGAGRAAVRTALARLEQEGLVERERYRGARVRLISEDEAIEIMETRIALECIAVRHAAERGTREERAELRAIVERMETDYRTGDLLSYSEGNSKLHALLIRMARHSTVAKVLDTLNTQSVRFQYRTILAKGRPEHSLSEHKAIVEAVMRRDADEADQAMRRHLTGVLNTLLRLA